MASSTRPNLPSELISNIFGFINPIPRFSALQALNGKRDSVAKRLQSCAWIWSLIFKDDTWVREVLKIQNHHGGEPIPCVIGSDLGKLFAGKSNGTYIALCVNDWTGDVRYLKSSFFACLQEHVYNESRSEVYFKNSGLTVHVADVLGGDECITMKDPRKLFHGKHGKLRTNALYYTEDVLHNIGPSLIGGVEGLSTRKKKYVRDICSVRSKFRGGDPVFRIFICASTTLKVVGIHEKDANGRKWLVRWRPA